MKSILRIALGIIAALGGFLDIGDIVFTTQAGALAFSCSSTSDPPLAA